MSFLPLVSCYLRTAARKRATYWLRSILAAAALAVGVATYLDDPHSPPEQIAKDMLQGLLFFSLIVCITLGLVSSADCVSAEKRGGTLGLLFLTKLRGWDILLGKFSAASVGGFFWLLATVPILALSLLFGGVSGSQVGCQVLLLVATFFFQISLAIFASVLSRKQIRSTLGALTGLVFFSLALPACGAVVLYLVPSHHSLWAQCLFFPSPILTLITSLEAPPVPELDHFWWSLATIHGLTWFFLALSSLILPHCWMDKPADGWRLRWQRARQRWSFGPPEERKRLRTRLLELNSFCWLTGRFRHKPAYVWAFFALLAGLWTWGGLRFGADWFHQGIYLPTALLLNYILKLWVAAEAGRQLFEDRRAGGLEYLLTTPLSVKEILHGHFVALRRQFMGPLLVIVTVELIFLAAAFQRESFRANPITPTLWLVIILLLAADLAAISWVGPWTALTVKPPNHPAGLTILRLFIAPACLFYVSRVVADVVLGPGPFEKLTWKVYVGMWVAISLLTDFAYGLAAWRQLHANFRRIAVERPPSLYSQLARWLRPARIH